MSSILKALKKLEEEKYARQAEDLNLSREILKPQKRQSNKRKWLWTGGIALFSAFIILTALLIGTRSSNVGPVPSMTPKPSPTKVETVLPVGRAIVSKPDSGSGVKSSYKESGFPSGEIIVKKERSQLQQQPIVPSREHTIKTELPPSVPAPPDSTHPEAGKKPLQTHSPDPVELSLTLSGIAWNKDSADRLAIINGHPAATGAIISGAVVKEILPDRVRMELSGRTFELLLGRHLKTN